ncbi:unnamed protein product [Ostreobium quekettii]|uniref:Uncharacterized protein n=1 Tax=Ostreobium quekettii TaxID=121088 RepID=A0A8S1J785_9CHLO|nr:unnamed protein product [Ostreobium quekettii]|eukprot:evm.model.scf_1194EXC.1 EVM.evm.TU.scf_1194EXC.1   scf_1194EXC:4917-7309(-)
MGMWSALRDTAQASGVKFSEHSGKPTAEEAAKDWDGNGKVAIVTGPYAGLGKETTRVLALRGAEVVMAGRSKAKADAAIDEIRKENPGAKLRFMELDLSSLASVKKFADDFRATGLAPNVLVNNAGIMLCPYGLSADGYEMQFATNHLGHFLLTRLLLPDLEAAANASGVQSRVVTVSSHAHHFPYRGGLRFDDLAKPKAKGYNRSSAYGASKLANILFTRELDSRLRGRKSGVTAVCSHPGLVPTELARNFNPLVLRMAMWILRKVAPSYREIRQGASSQVYLCTAPKVDGGEYYMDCAIMPTSKQALDREMASKLWGLSEDMCTDYLEKGNSG